MDQVREALVAEGLAARTVREYLRAIQRADDWFAARGSTLATATAVGVAEYVASRPGSWSNRNLMRAALGHYWRIVERDRPPVGAIRVPPKPEWPCQALEEDDCRILAKYARQISDDGDRRGLGVLCGMYLALRRAEIARLRWDQFDNGTMRVMGKGLKDAWLPVNTRLAGALLAWPGDRDGAMFLGRKGNPVAPATIWTWTANVAEEAGLGKVRTHQLRHSALATMNDATGDLRATQTFARHSKPETTSHYTRTTARRLQAVAETLDY